MSTIDKIRALLKLGQQRKFYAEARLDDGRLVVTEAESMAIGAEVFVMTEEGQAEPVADGEYTLEDGTKLVVADGRINQLGEEAPEVEAEAQPESKEEAMADHDDEKMGDMRKKLSEIGLEDDMVTKVIEVVEAMYPNKEEAEEDKPTEDMNETLTAMAEATAEGMKQLLSRIEALENQPASEGVKHSPSKDVTSSTLSSPQEFSTAWESALYNIQLSKQN